MRPRERRNLSRKERQRKLRLMKSSSRPKKIRIKKLRRLSKGLMNKKRSQKNNSKIEHLENFQKLRKMRILMTRRLNQSPQRNLINKLNLTMRMMLLRSQ
tara:strand:- start:523 stop:822 length:300 start_codon:yes stop_codon:yes gene_type:complete